MHTNVSVYGTQAPTVTFDFEPGLLPLSPSRASPLTTMTQSLWWERGRVAVGKFNLL